MTPYHVFFIPRHTAASTPQPPHRSLHTAAATPQPPNRRRQTEAKCLCTKEAARLASRGGGGDGGVRHFFFILKNDLILQKNIYVIFIFKAIVFKKN